MKPSWIKTLNRFTFYSSALAILSTTACQVSSNDLGPNIPRPDAKAGLLAPVEINLQREVDILFVIDNSGSMKNHQENLANSIDRFVDGFAKSSIVDFQIGVVSIWDRERYGYFDLEKGEITKPGIVNALSREGKSNFDLAGHLRPLKVPQGKEDLLTKQPSRFVRNQSGFAEVLKETLKIGVSEYVGKTTDKQEATGPEFEDLFTPVLAAISEPVRAKGSNAGFIREKDAHLAIVLVSDANDAGTFTPGEVKERLLALKNGDRSKVSVHGLIIPPGMSSETCKRDNAGVPAAQMELIKMTGGLILNLCDQSQAKNLAKLGREISDRTAKEIEFPINIPEIGSISVTYGGRPLPKSQTSGWSYDQERQVVIIRDASQWARIPNEPLKVSYIPVDTARRSSICRLGCRSRN